MKKFIFLFAVLFLFMQKKGLPQQSNNGKTWSEVDSLEQKGLYRSARDKVKAIYARAVQTGNEQEQIKSLLYQLKYRTQIEEDANAFNLKEVDSLVNQSTGTQKAILQSMLAEMYWNYSQTHRYTLYNRLPSSAENDEDVNTWSLPHLYQRATALYEASLQDTLQLRKTNLNRLTTIVDTGKHALNLQPTLYDLLANRALSYFMSGDAGVMNPAQHFTIDNVAAFAPGGKFSSVEFPAEDTADLNYKALKLYQEIIRFHLQDRDPAALIDVDLQRLQFVYQKAILPGKDSLYKRALENIIEQYPNATANAQVKFTLAQWYYSNGMQYNATAHPGVRYDLKKALDICNKIISSPAKEAAVSAKRLKDQILRTAFSLQVELVNTPDKPFRVLVDYKNATNLWFRLVKLPDNPPAVFQHGNPSLADLVKQKTLKSWQQAFPDTQDYQSHAAEIKVEALPHGRYALLVSPDKTFNKGKFPVESVVFYVSSISYIQNNGGDYLVLDRETGKPLEGATVHLWHTQYNKDRRKNELGLYGIYTTGKQGSFHLEADPKYNNLMPEVSWNNDHLFTGQSQWIAYVNSEKNDEDTAITKTYLFTDRSIYRPGQTVHFKGIHFLYDQQHHKGEVLKNKEVTIYLFDANNQQADSLRLTSSDFGSYAGTFVLPKALLNGYMHLETADHQASVYFSVEEYKRPTFYMEWDTTTHAYRLGDTVNIKGNVRTYSQASLDGATVKYQVTRRTRVIFPWYRGNVGKGFLLPRDMASIAQGATTTDEHGNFTIRFPAIPDETTDSALNPVFDYVVSADITDINGESHPFNYTLLLGYQSLELDLDVPKSMSVKDLDTLHLSSRTLDGKFVPAAVTISLLPVDAPERYIRSRYWKQPDEFIINKQEYIADFPHDEYKDELDPTTWKEESPIITIKSTTNNSGTIGFGTKKLKPGWYAVKVSATDENGRLVKVTKYVRLFDMQAKEFPFKDPLWVSKEQVEAQPGDRVSWQVAADGPTNVYTQYERLEKTDSIQHELIDNTIRKETIPVTDADRGGIIQHYVAVRYNRIFSHEVRVMIPWDNKQLHIQYETFRDKLLPGAEEQWKMKITGAHGEHVAAELLASMYDASLDAFRPNIWIQPDIYPTTYGKINWQDGGSFRGTRSYNIFNPKSPTYPTYTKIYPSLNWFGYNFGYRFSPRAPVALRGNAAGVFASAEDSRQGLQEAKVQNLTTSEVVRYEKSKDTTASQTQQSLEQQVSVRKNFNETAFFFPQLQTDDKGNVVFSFTMPEALTKWKLMMFAHTKDMRYAYAEKETVTQKPLMVQSNAPRFVRQGDNLVFSAKVSNLSKENLTGNAVLELTDLSTGKVVNTLLGNNIDQQSFNVNAGQSTAMKWNLTVPDDYTGGVSYKIVVTAGDYSDGEQNAIPVLTNRALITESLPLHFKGNGRHQLDFDAIKQMGKSNTLQPQSLTIEYTNNPVWYAVQALPFLAESNQQSADEYFNQVYANALSSYVAGHIPRFKETMQDWLTRDTNALKSPLQTNEDLKSVLLQETPWVQAAQSESSQKATIAKWFDQKESIGRLEVAANKLKEMQLSNGGFSWFKDMRDDRYITQRIITGIGHLMKFRAIPEGISAILQSMVEKGVPYLDARMKESYDDLMKNKIKAYSLGPIDIQYLYMRSFFGSVKMEDSVKAAYNFYKKLAAEKWVDQPVYLKAMIALVMNRSKDTKTAQSILKSLAETAIRDSVKGMYWKQTPDYYRWYQAPVETQAVCIEAFDEISHDQQTVDDLRGWLLSQKETQQWPTTTATADAVYALLLTGTQWASTSPEVKITTGDKSFTFGDHNDQSGMQYNKVQVSGKEVTPDMKKINVQVKGAANNQPTWGAVYFQYFENMNKVEKANNEISISREISLEETKPTGPELIPVTQGTQLKTGDKVQVRMVVKINQDMDYIHLKDVRAACMEPLQTISRYNWEGGVGYYFTVTDAAVHYYFSHLPRGTYVFTYPVYITHDGKYTGGMSTIECLYAPSMRAHSEGVEVKVGD